MTNSQKKAQSMQKLAGSKILDQHGDFLLVDMLVGKYPQYTHDDVFDMPLPMVEELLIINKKQAFISSRAEEINRELTTNNR